MDFRTILDPIISLGGMGLIFGAGLAYASQKFAVEVDERVTEIRNVLPGANCGACVIRDVTGLQVLLRKARHR